MAHGHDKIRLRTNAEWQEEDRHRASRRGGRSTRFVGLGLFAAAAVVAAAVVFYPKFSGDLQTPAHPGPHASEIAPPTAMVVRDANLRANPSAASAAVSKLSRGAEVTVLERHGNWTRVASAASEGEAPREGWIYDTLLKSADGDVPPSSPTRRP